MKRTTGIIALTLLSSTLLAQNVTVRFHYVPGTVYRYKMSMTMLMSGITGQKPTPMSMSMALRQKVKSVAKNGDATLVGQVENTTMLVNGKAMPSKQGSNPSMTTVVSPDGTTKSATGGGLSMGGSPMSIQTPLPPGPVHVGSTWNTSMDMMGITVKLHSKLTNIYKRNGHQLISVKSAGTGSIAPGSKITQGTKMMGKIAFDMNWDFDMTASAAVSTTANSRFTMHAAAGAQGKPMDISGNQKMTLQLIGISKG